MHLDETRGLLANLISRGAAFIIQQLGYTPANKAGDTFTGDVGVGNVAPITVLQASGGGVPASIANLNAATAGTRANSLFQLANPAVRLAIAYLGSDNPAIQAFDTGNAAKALDLNPFGGVVRLGAGLQVNSATMIATATPFTNGAAAAAGTLANAPVAGNPTKWIPINDNGTTRYIPAW